MVHNTYIALFYVKAADVFDVWRVGTQTKLFEMAEGGHESSKKKKKVQKLQTSKLCTRRAGKISHKYLTLFWLQH